MSVPNAILTPKIFTVWTRIEGQPAVKRQIELPEGFDSLDEYVDDQNLQPQEEAYYTENPDPEECLAKRFAFEIDGQEQEPINYTDLVEYSCENPEILNWMHKAEINEYFKGSEEGDSLRRIA